MIRDLKLSNFQSHKKTEFNFHPGITVITGETDVGKSAVIRGLKWVALNKPPGDSVRRHHTKLTDVDLDGVRKTRSASKHQYSHNSKVYKALRSDVPAPISDTLRLSDVNFQGQHDTYFLIGDSPGHVARELNEVADLQVIDLSLKRVKQLTKTMKDEEKQLKTEIKDKKLEVEELSWAVTADKDLSEIEILEQKVKAITNNVVNLRERYDRCNLIKSELETIPIVTKDQSLVSYIFNQLQQYDDSLSMAIDQVEINQVNIPSTNSEIIILSDILNQLSTSLHDDIRHAISNIENNQVTIPDIDDPSQEILKLKTKTSECNTLQDALIGISSSEIEYKITVDKHLIAEEKVNELLISLGICPLCGSETCS